MAANNAGAGAMTVEDLPRLLAGVTSVEPERVALVLGDTSVTYAQLKSEIETLDAAMGGVLGIDSLVPVVLSNLVPGLLESAEHGDCRACSTDCSRTPPRSSATARPRLRRSSTRSRRSSISRLPPPPTRWLSSSTASP
ncbi:hypothetical protein P9209_10425 [Prescottella defluvii]|nr:hypothetical protein P9209_10425 [Prescottella defluvii]